MAVSTTSPAFDTCEATFATLAYPGEPQPRKSMTPAAAIAEKDLAERHRSVWPPRLTAIDADWHVGDRIILEAPSRYQTVVPIEYKSVLAGSLDLNAWQYTVFRRGINQSAPAFVAQFTNPPHADTWAFRLHPVVEIAGELLDDRPITLTERQLVELLTLITTGTTYGLQAETFTAAFDLTDLPNRLAGPCPRCGEHVAAGGGVLAYNRDTRRPAPVHRNLCGAASKVTASENAGREFFTHLDDALPPPSTWPSVTPLKRYETFVPTFALHIARRWIAEYTDHFASGTSSATITPLTANRPSLGALRRKKVGGREEIQQDYAARARSSWQVPKPARAPIWVERTRSQQKSLPGPFSGSRRDVGFSPSGLEAPPVPRPTPYREPAQVGRVHPLPATTGVRACGVARCSYLAFEQDDRGPICRTHQNPPEPTLRATEQRVRDGELQPHESGTGWACPVCVQARLEFAGERGQRRCLDCARRWPTLTNAVAREELRRQGG